MRLSVLGSGSAFTACGCNAGYLIDSRVLVDAGAPAHVLMRRIAASVADLQLILLTHFHADHSFMLPMVLGAVAFGERQPQPRLVIAGPVGTREFTHRLLRDGYGAHLLHLIDDHLHPEFVTLQDGSDVVINGYRVRAHAVVHSVGPSLAYVVSDAEGTSVGFSGDSTLCAGLERAVAAADAFVCECTSWSGPVPGGHMWSSQVAALVEAYPDVAFILSHLTERRELPGALIAHDLLTLDIRQRARGGAATS